MRSIWLKIRIAYYRHLCWALKGSIRHPFTSGLWVSTLVVWVILPFLLVFVILYFVTLDPDSLFFVRRSNPSLYKAITTINEFSPILYKIIRGSGVVLVVIILFVQFLIVGPALNASHRLSRGDSEDAHKLLHTAQTRLSALTYD